MKDLFRRFINWLDEYIHVIKVQLHIEEKHVCPEPEIIVIEKEIIVENPIDVIEQTITILPEDKPTEGLNIKHYQEILEKNIVVFTDEDAFINHDVVFNMPVDEFIGNRVKDQGQLFVDEGKEEQILYVSIPNDTMKDYKVRLKLVYDDGTNKEIENDMVNIMDHYCSIFAPLNILSNDRCYLVKIIISLVNVTNKKKRYDLDLVPIYNFDLDKYIEPIDYFEIYRNVGHTDEIHQFTILENSAYKVNKDDVPFGKVFLHPMPEEGKYMIRTYDVNNNMFDEKVFGYSPDECWFEYHEKVTKVILYKLSDKNVDAITIYFK